MSTKRASLYLFASFVFVSTLTLSLSAQQRQVEPRQGNSNNRGRTSNRGGQTQNGSRTQNQNGNRARRPSKVSRATNMVPVRREMNRPFPALGQRHIVFRKKLLDYWEESSRKVKRYKCTFKSWEYNPAFAPKSEPFKYSEGKIQYQSPDKGLFQETRVMQYTVERGKKPDYKQIGKYATREHWLCNGRSVFRYNYPQRELEESILPQEMRGRSIADGPIPFLFGARTQKMLARYFIRVITPQGEHEQYWLEAFPRWPQDQANFQKVHIIIDREKWLPKGMVIFPPNHHPTRNPARRSFTFINRQVNYVKRNLISNLFSQEFYEPKRYSGWRRTTKRIPSSVPKTGRR